jgi:hypothetical protein
MFTLAQRDELREYMVRLANADERVVAGALVGSLAAGGGDRYSDLDLTFGVDDEVPISAVLADWTDSLSRDLDGIRLVDLKVGPTTYRVFLLPGALQVDLSMTPAARFRPAGPRWRLLFGETAAEETTVASPPPPRTTFIPIPPVEVELYGWAVIYALHARACIERGRVWQAAHYIGAVRDHALTMSCLRLGLPSVQARGLDDLPYELLSRFTDTHIKALEHDALRSALAAAVTGLMQEAACGDIANAEVIESRLADLV